MYMEIPAKIPENEEDKSHSIVLQLYNSSDADNYFAKGYWMKIRTV
ncbi:hypothetical protein [Candidatus Venteria ishoeyi]|uniref:Uncharacterized protein n=1 Tax=Candidatus Venteria ishoeyi TaxID=1899563 RepID=A0A1H6F5T5_9GAMM|nr:hypothetical protein [Candidatus Venteria ishoeyi]SEH05151.1 Uncharacterised protein [Candidatus Venteria ishoeyi]SEH05537.1 Uncharacterised protein [Candidatus Venteria ishoeyi]